MKTKIFTAALILAAILSASCSYAAVTPQQALADPRFAPYVEATKQNGSSLLSGRYAITTEITSRTGGQKILAPTNMIFNIGQFDTQINAYPLNADVYGSNIVPLYMTLDTQAQAPIIKTYRADSSGQYDVVGEDYAVVINQGGSRAWFVASVSDGEINYFFPLDDASLFPKGWYLGAWKCSDGTQFTFEGDTISSNGQAIGTFNVSDNRIIVTTPDGQKDVIYALRNPEKDTLVMTFTSGPNGMGVNAGVFERIAEAPKTTAPRFPAPSTTTPEAPKPPKFPVPTQIHQPSEPQMPTEFPPMPKVDLPSPSLNIDGVWAANVNGHQWITQFQDGNYYGWIDGRPSEMGIIRIEGSTITGTNNHGVDFKAELELDPSGKILDMKFGNGNVIRYQKVQ